MRFHHILLAAMAILPAVAQAQTATDVVVMRKAIAPPRKPVMGTWTVTVQKVAQWGECTGGVMTTTNVNVTCSSATCDAASKPTTVSQTCSAKRNCNVNWTNKAANLSCDSVYFRNGYFSNSSAAEFCSAFPDVVGCTTNSNTQASACIKSGTYTTGWATNTVATTCK